MTKRIEWVDVYKGILIILVVLAHSLQEVYLAYRIDFTSDLFRNIIYSFHMPAFMAMSGYLVYKPKSTTTCMGGVFAIINKKFKQLIIPMLIWIIPFSYVKNTSYMELILYPNKGYWFIWALFFIIIIFNFIDYGCKKLCLQQEIGMMAATGAMMVIQMMIPNPQFLAYEYIAYYFLFYLIGYYANKYKDILPRNVIWLFGLFALWFIMACYWTPNGLPFFLEKVSYVPSRLLQLAYRCLTPIVFVIAMYLLVPRLKKTNNYLWKMLIDLGQISLGIYLVHMVIKRYITICLFDLLSSLSVWILVIIDFFVLIVVSVGIVKLFSKWEISNRWLLGRF